MAQNQFGVEAPVVLDVRDMLSISPAEALAKAKEDTLALASANRIPDQDLLENQEMATGYTLDHNELIRRIQLLNPKILIMPGGVRGAAAVRYPKMEDGEMQNVYITGFYLEPLPEYSSVICDEMGNAKREIRGWRSVLLALLRVGALDIEKTDAMFGPASGQRSGLWYRSLQGKGLNL